MVCRVDSFVKKEMHVVPVVESTCILHRIH